MLKNLLVLILSISFSITTFAYNPLVGTWISMDDKNQKTSTVNVYEHDGKIFAKITKILTTNTIKSNFICKKCPGKFKNQPIEGLIILWNLTPSGKNSWDNGKTLDPKTGKILDTQATLSTDENTINLNYKLGFFSTTRTWIRSN